MNGPHSKCGVLATVPGVRIPPPPQNFWVGRQIGGLFCLQSTAGARSRTSAVYRKEPERPPKSFAAPPPGWAQPIPSPCAEALAKACSSASARRSFMRRRAPFFVFTLTASPRSWGRLRRTASATPSGLVMENLFHWQRARKVKHIVMCYAITEGK